jgi:hypothetical protein
MRVLLILCLSFSLFGCIGTPEPEGPAERIGKSIDELTRGAREFGATWDTATRARNRGSDWTTRDENSPSNEDPRADDWREPSDSWTSDDTETQRRQRRNDFEY